MDAAMHAGRWEKTIGIGLNGATTLIVGYGRIGRRVARLLTAFGAHILVVEPAISEQDAAEVELVALHEGLSRADVVTLHASGSNELLREPELAALKPGAIVLNSARGGLVDESALIGALESGRVRGAWLDAFTQEPYDGPLTRYPQVLLTPHVSTYTRDCRREMEVAAVRNLCRDLGLSGPPGQKEEVA
jgi:D-3-phosphoglycerate dehydrogenase